MRPLRIGITGHRPHKLVPAFLPALEGHLHLAMHRAAMRVHPQVPECVVSLAEGADTIAAEKALELGWRLIAPLPFPADDYAQDFTDGALDTFRALLANSQSFACTPARGHFADDADAYRAASHAMLDLSHGLIAMWNGAPTELLGGAFDTIGEALSRGLPVLWIHTASYDDPVYLAEADRPALAAGAPRGSGGEDDFLAALMTRYSAAG